VSQKLQGHQQQQQQQHQQQQQQLVQEDDTEQEDDELTDKLDELKAEFTQLLSEVRRRRSLLGDPGASPVFEVCTLHAQLISGVI
jgi:hypothetical protein